MAGMWGSLKLAKAMLSGERCQATTSFLLELAMYWRECLLEWCETTLNAYSKMMKSNGFSSDKQHFRIGTNGRIRTSFHESHEN